MSGLYPTPTRLALLGEVRRGQVQIDATNRASYLADSGAKVTTRIAELITAGWVRLSKSSTWDLTAPGREVLDANGGRRRA